MKRLLLIPCLLCAAQPAIPQQNTDKNIDAIFDRAHAMEPIACDAKVLEYIRVDVQRDRNKEPEPPDPSNIEVVRLEGCPLVAMEAEQHAFTELKLAYSCELTRDASKACALATNQTKVDKLAEEFGDATLVRMFADEARNDVEQLTHRAVASTQDADPRATVTVFYWANDLNDACQTVPVSAGTSLPRLTKDAITSPEFLNMLKAKEAQGVCAGYIVAQAEALTHSVGKVCFPLHNPADELIAAVKVKLANSSVLRDKQLPASIAVDLALGELFPCPRR